MFGFNIWSRKSGVWERMIRSFTRVSGNWEELKNIWVKVSGIWEPMAVTTNRYAYNAGGKRVIGGALTCVSEINYFNVNTTTGNGVDRGNLTRLVYLLAGLAGGLYDFFGGGHYIDPLGVLPNQLYNVIDYIDNTLTTGNAIDRGNLTVARHSLSSVHGPQYGFWAGGENDPGSVYYNVIDYIDTSILSGNAVDKGNLSRAITYLCGGVNSSTYGFICGGYYSGNRRNYIDYINVTTTTGNALDKGNLTIAGWSVVGVSGSTYGFMCGGGERYNVIDYINMLTTTGNAIDRGNLTVSLWRAGNSSSYNSNNLGFLSGGSTLEGGINVIQYMDTSLTIGNAVDKGDLPYAIENTSGA